MSEPRTQAMIAGRREVVIRTLRLEIIAGTEQGKVIESSDEITAGSDPMATIVLTDPMVSRMHFALRPQVDGWILRDLGSTNGTRVNGVDVREAGIEPGQTITLGKTTLRVSIGGTVSQPLSEEASWGTALGKSAAMRRLFAVLPRIAASDAVVLLEGETGTGKTLLASAIHQHSDRRGGPFVVVDCGAIAPTLVESELFGHEKGAFTGAHAQRAGAFEAASGGTLFFDELGELPLDLQPKLLRVLEDKVVRRVGGTSTVPIDVRVIAATNRELRREVNRGTFRSDLYYRLNTIRLTVPPLRDRREDITLLAERFWRDFSPREPRPLPDELLDELLRRDWPGNVRELRSAVERAALLGDPGAPADEPTEPRSDLDVETEIASGQPFRDLKEQTITRWERAFIRHLVDQHGGNVSRAARAARMDRSYLRDLLLRHWPKPE